jgi:hypothetical protein
VLKNSIIYKKTVVLWGAVIFSDSTHRASSRAQQICTKFPPMILCLHSPDILHHSITYQFSFTVVGANLAFHVRQKQKVTGSEGLGGIADKEEHTLHSLDVIFQWQYFVARCPSSSVGKVFGLHSICFCFPSTLKLVT